MTKACLLAVLLALGGCDQLDNCPDALDPIPVEPRPADGEDPGSTDLDALTYESAPWEGPLHAFPASTILRFEHDLGHRPTFVTSYVSFSADGTNDGDSGDVTENAGNQGRILCVDAHEIIIENDTCEEDFYIRVVAMATGHESTAVVCQKEIDRR